MKLVAIHVYDADLPVVGTYRMSSGPMTRLTSVIVELVTDTGLVGYGEVCPLGPVYQPQHVLGAKAAIAEMAPKLIGQDPTLVVQLNRAMNAALDGHRYAKAAIDIAAWDLAGKRYDRRLCDLLGGAAADSVSSYYAVAVASPDEQARVAAERQREGYRRLQIKIGGREVEEDIETLRRVGEVLQPGTRLAADGNRGMTGRDTILLGTYNYMGMTFDPEVIAAGNIGCMMQIGSGTGVPVVHTAELLDWATGGPCPRALASAGR